MKRLTILLVLMLGLVIAPTKSAFALQINWADIFVTPNGDTSIVGGYLGGDGNHSTNEWIDWSIGNCVPFSGAVTDDLVFSTAVGDFMNSANWHERMRITKDGNIGIGTANPTEKLTVAGTIESTSGGFKFPDGSIQTTAASSGGGGRYIGELYGGGVVFYVDHTGNHGLICSMIDLSTAQIWSNINSALIGSAAQSDWNGQGNTNAIIGQSGHSSSAAKLCDDYTNVDYGTGVYSDWYLLSSGELNDLWNNIKAVQKALDIDGNAATTAIIKDCYWSSSEYSFNYAWGFYFYYGYPANFSKGSRHYVRAVRAF
ncbi:MAG: DUF1566 domain-containing protein [Nitrospirota bacterium]